MKHKRVTNRKIKQMMDDINHDGLFDSVVNADDNQSMIEGKQQTPNEVPPNIQLDSENK
ncbi:hypothetical protein L4D09_09835 [Photobacterium makurazakiensis]|uniref:hypothetical protein n=1 Tax=Photobacterium makurazakiensis TaxID=2910234 RepID=UPI003D135D7A